jgi:predicted ATPase/class 3 adenylate cyclase/DNA-binding CsgD family transcriptional regulator
VSELLPTGTVTLLLADVEGSTRLWQTHPEEMTAAFARLDQCLAGLVSAHHGVRPLEQGEGDSFVVAFARAGDAVECALDLQRAPLAPIRLRIGVHTGDVQLRDDANYIGPTINRCARLRDLAHGGQTVLSASTHELVADCLPADAWLTDLGTHQLRDLPRPERVVQLCHPDVRNDFPPLRTTIAVAAPHLPVQLTSFIGRGPQLAEVRQNLAENRLVTLTGAGGAGKTSLAIQVAAQVAEEYPDGVWYVDLAPIADPAVVPITVISALGLPDQPDRSTVETLQRFIANRRMLVVVDNCEHLLDATAAMACTLLGACPGLTLLATSREPIGVTGEVTWRVPSLSLDDEAITLFTDRARLAVPSFRVNDDNAASVAEICRRLDGMPLAIELAAARLRALSVDEIIDSLHDRFRLLTGGARSGVRRQQTLRASVDWSHDLLTEPERVLFRRLAVFLGGFDLDAAQSVAGGDDLARHQVLDLLALLVDKSLVVAENTRGRTRYRLLETVRQYAAEKLSESGEVNAARKRHRDHYAAMAAALDTPAREGSRRRLTQAETEIDNLRAAFAWSREQSDVELALTLASSLQPLWVARGRIREGLAWIHAALSAHNRRQPDIAPAVRARALADKSSLAAVIGAEASVDEAQEALAIARNLDDPALLVRALTACASVNAFNPELARPYINEGIELARAIGDRWRLSQLLGWQIAGAYVAGDPIAARAASEKGLDLAEAMGDRLVSRQCRWLLGWAQLWQGDLASAIAQFGQAITEAEAARDLIWKAVNLGGQGCAFAYRGNTQAASAATNAAGDASAELGGPLGSPSFDTGLGVAALAAGDAAAVPAPADTRESTLQRFSGPRGFGFQNLNVIAQLLLARGDLAAARRWAAEAVSTTVGWHQMVALTTRARVAIAGGIPEQAERDLHAALALAAGSGAHMGIADILECLAALAVDAGSHPEAARLFGAADGARRRMGAVRFKIYDAAYEASVAELRNAMAENDFQEAWAEGAALSTEEAIAYAQRGHDQHKRPTSGWASLTPTERDVSRLVSEGLANKDIATRLFVSPRTVQTHLTHIYTKLGLTSRVQLAQEAARRAQVRT